MSRTAWFNCSVGTAGDMTLAALVDAGADQMAIGSILAGLPIDDYALTFEKTQRCGVTSTRAIVAVHDHGHAHSHTSWREIRTLLESGDLPTRVRERALAVFSVLAEVEARIHGVPLDEVGFHEVGAVDSIVDIVGVCAALEVLDISNIVCSPIGTGHGSITTQHGVVPNPAPATSALCASRGVPMVGLDDPRELATPTGVAIMVALAHSFGPIPGMNIEQVGHGAGAGDFEARANVVKVVVGETAVASMPSDGQPVRLLECNVDDVTGEVVAHTIGALLAAGAHDAWATPIIMKKGRPAFTVHALCDVAATTRISEVMVRETGTLGLRGSVIERWPQRRDESVVHIDGHAVRVKISGTRVKVEHDDAARAAAALGLPLRDVMSRAEQAAR